MLAPKPPKWYADLKDKMGKFEVDRLRDVRATRNYMLKWLWTYHSDSDFFEQNEPPANKDLRTIYEEYVVLDKKNCVLLHNLRVC